MSGTVLVYSSFSLPFDCSSYHSVLNASSVRVMPTLIRKLRMKSSTTDGRTCVTIRAALSRVSVVLVGETVALASLVFASDASAVARSSSSSSSSSSPRFSSSSIVPYSKSSSSSEISYRSTTSSSSGASPLILALAQEQRLSIEALSARCAVCLTQACVSES